MKYCGFRNLRGGAFDLATWGLRTSDCSWDVAECRFRRGGFRVVVIKRREQCPPSP